MSNSLVSVWVGCDQWQKLCLDPDGLLDRDYPCAINQLNRQVASHPLNKSPVIFNKQAIASVKWIYRENFGDTSIAGLLMAYTGL